MPWLSNYKAEIRAQLRLSWPLAVAEMANYTIFVIAIFFTTFFSKTDSDAANLSTAFTDLTGLAFCKGFTWACDTFFSQAFGSDNSHQIGVFL